MASAASRGPDIQSRNFGCRFRYIINVRPTWETIISRVVALKAGM